MNEKEQRLAARTFAKTWEGRGDEKSDTHSFWRDLLHSVFGIKEPTPFIEFEKRIQLENKSYIDAMIPLTKVLIEQKSIYKDLTKPIKQSDGTELTPFEQAKRYADHLPFSEKPRWIVVCNFETFHVYDMEEQNKEPYIIELKNLEKEFYRLRFLVNTEDQKIIEEMEISLQAGSLVGDLYKALSAKYADPTAKSSQISLNKLCVRLVFLLYAEDSNLLSHHLQFHDYLSQYKPEQMRGALKQLFSILNTPESEREEGTEDQLLAFPYINGGLFADVDGKNNVIPQFDENIAELLLVKASEEIDWSKISPTIFGSVFESTLNPETRHDGGMHYTSIENIHKVIDPLFLDDLRAELKQILAVKIPKIKADRLLAYQTKLASLTFLDPACGSGNFLTETFLSLRRLENVVVRELSGGLGYIFDPIQVGINQFYGIEINDFACTVAKTALWIAEAQMQEETENILEKPLGFFPLKSNSNIHEGNALTLDWNEVVPKDRLNFIMGNPPFLGARVMGKTQKEDLKLLWGKTIKSGNLDYVTGWYAKASDFIQNTGIKCALVSTNSICQGEQVPLLWKYLKEQKNIDIDFAYRTFRWDSEATSKAHVHCVIIGFSCSDEDSKRRKLLVSENGEKTNVPHINSYLINGEDVFIESRSRTICDVPQMVFGSMANDGGHLILDVETKCILENDSEIKPFLRSFTGSKEFINGLERYCLWLEGASPKTLRASKELSRRVEAVKKFRESSSREATKKLAETSWLFGERRQPKDGQYLIIPRVSSERRRYAPIGFLSSEVIASDACLIVPNAELYHFAIMTSSVHMAWMRAVCGRLESRYRYSASVVYNNFVWPELDDKTKTKLAKTAQKILDARLEFPDLTLADLYDDDYMPANLRKAHDENNRLVKKAYGFASNLTEEQIVAQLLKLYKEKVDELGKKK